MPLYRCIDLSGSNSESINAQTKIVTPTFSYQDITPDATYNALSLVKVEPIPVTEESNIYGGETLTVGGSDKAADFESALGLAVQKEGLFNGNTNLKLTKLPRNTTTISNYCFWGCTGITISEIPAGVTTIGNSAFTGCTGITSLTFKGTPTSIPSWTFGDNANLKDIYVPWAEGAVANAPWGASSATIHYNSTV